MANINGEDKSKSRDFYKVLGLNKECTPTELRNAYKKLALRWHPDRCAASGSSKFEDEAKQNFQAIQQAYSVLSDDNKRFMYDVGAYDSDDDENGMGDFLSEMAVMMSQTKPNGNGEESFEELEELFEEMFQNDITSFEDVGFRAAGTSSYGGSSSSSSNQNSTGMNFGGNKAENSTGFSCHTQKFCLGVEQKQSFKKGKGAKRGIQGVVGGGSRRINASKRKGF